jgi:hypothetical protein
MSAFIHPELGDERVFAGLHYAGYHAWLNHVWHAAACTRPIRLRGDIKHIDAATGELLRTIPTIGMPDGSIYKACGNRRATTCPGCAETYRRDAYHLLRAGLIGGKGVTPDVAAHPAMFVTFTAPSFGPVHSRPVRASPGTAPAIPSSASRCARTATTTPPTSSGTTPQANSGGAPNKPSNVTSASSPAAVACSRSGSPAATANTA